MMQSGEIEVAACTGGRRRARPVRRSRRTAGTVAALAAAAACLLAGLASRPTAAAEPAKPTAAAKPAVAPPTAAKPTVAVPATPGGPVTTASLEARFNGQVKPLLVKHCYSCHGNGKHKGDLSLDPYTTLVSVQSAREQWGHIAEVMKQKLMPPEEKPQPSQAEFDAVVGWVNDALAFCDCSGPRDPGRVAVHRLNRTEYNNTIRDLLGVDYKPAKDFPADDTGYGFDNIADVLTMSPLLAEKYLAAAEQVLEQVIPAENPNKSRKRTYSDSAFKASGEGNNAGALTDKGETSFTHEFHADGVYELRVRGSGRKLDDEAPKVQVRIDGKVVGTVEPAGARDKPVTLTVKADAKAGKRKVSLALLNPKTAEQKDKQGKPRKVTRAATIDAVEVEGPIGAAPPPPSPGYRRIFVALPGKGGQNDEAAARAVLQRFVTRAYRRPAQPDEVESLMSVYRSAKTDGENFEQSVRLCLTAVLVSPQFLFRVEVDPPAAVQVSAADPAKPLPYAVGEYELASRISYFLWSSAPDEELLGAAQSKKLRDPAVLEAQVRRMLKDPRSSALVENFAGQWLELRNLDDLKPDPKVYPAFDDKLKAAMKRETELFFEHVIREDRSVLELLTADYTFVNDRLAKHYGMPNVAGEQFRRVSLAGTKRAGFLTQASVLAVTAMPTRTSPVKRGKYVLENVLGTPPPPPPPDVASLSEDAKDVSKATLKVRLETHRADPNCAVCHVKMDAIGFSLENFDGIGQWRDRDGTFPVDSVGTLPDGGTLKGSDGLRAMLVKQQGEFVNCLVRKMLTYGLGRGLEYYDQCTVKDIEAAAKKDGYKFSAVVLAVVKSEPFQKRRMLRPDETRNRQEKLLDKSEKK